MWGGVTIFVAFALCWCFLLSGVSTCIRPCVTNNSTQGLTWMYHHTATESPYCLCGAKTNWKRTLAGVSYKFGFVHFSIHLQCISLDHQFCLFFFHKVFCHKVRKVTDPSFWKTFTWTWFGGLKYWKDSPKTRFLGFGQKSLSI